MDRRRIRRIVVKRFQLRLAMASMLYVYVGAMAFAALVFGPLIYKILSTSTPAEEREQIANAFLSLHATTWAGLALLLVVTGVSFVFSSHRIAGPLVRFQNVFNALRFGDLSDRVRLRDGDWLHDEAEALDAAVRHLRRRVSVLQGRSRRTETAIAALKAALTSRKPGEVERAVAELESAHQRVASDLQRFVTRRAPRRAPQAETPTGETWRESKAGFTLIELLVVCALSGTIFSIAAPLYGEALHAARTTRAIAEVRNVGREATAFNIRQGHPPDDLSEIGYGGLLDPWKRPYADLRIDGGKSGKGGLRKDHKLNPLNSDFDLYSVGRDGQTKTQISNKDSLDDIIRANDGGWVGLGRDF